MSYSRQEALAFLASSTTSKESNKEQEGTGSDHCVEGSLDEGVIKWVITDDNVFPIFPQIRTQKEC